MNDFDFNLKAFTKDKQDNIRFLLVHGHYPSEFELALFRAEHTQEYTCARAKAAVRPGLLNMMRYWL